MYFNPNTTYLIKYVRPFNFNLLVTNFILNSCRIYKFVPKIVSMFLLVDVFYKNFQCSQQEDQCITNFLIFTEFFVLLI